MQMTQLKWPQLLAAAGVAVTLLAACAIQLRGKADEDTAVVPQASSRSGALDTGLGRCRTVVPQQVEAFDLCRHLWAENRRRFFGKDPSRAADQKVGDPYTMSSTQLVGAPR
jgi:conjugative transfer region protein TrbK